MFCKIRFTDLFKAFKRQHFPVMPWRFKKRALTWVPAQLICVQALKNLCRTGSSACSHPANLCMRFSSSYQPGFDLPTDYKSEIILISWSSDYLPLDLDAQSWNITNGWIESKYLKTLKCPTRRGCIHTCKLVPTLHTVNYIHPRSVIIQRSPAYLAVWRKSSFQL